VKIKKFNDVGAAKYADFIKAASNGVIELSKLDVLLSNSEYAEDLDEVLDFSNVKSRFEMAELLWGVFSFDSNLRKFSGDANVWNYLSALYFKWLLGKQAKFLVGEEARWVLSNSALRFHRHLLFGPFFVYEANIDDPQRAMAALANPVTTPGEVVERVTGKANFAIGAAIELATLLYFDPATGELKKSSKTLGRSFDKKKPGSPQRLSIFLNQIDLTVDFTEMEVSALLEILPNEFKVWLKD
jgi:hypothetical protein